jgi:hypothetical protein
VTKFDENARYYKIATFESKYTQLQGSMGNETNGVIFMRDLLQEFISDTLHANSYLQEHLLEIYKALDEMLTFSMLSPTQGVVGSKALYREILEFEPVLQTSIERGRIKFGFVREHAHWYQHPLPVMIRYVLSPLFGGSKVAHQTRSILPKVEAMNANSLHTTSNGLVLCHEGKCNDQRDYILVVRCLFL